MATSIDGLDEVLDGGLTAGDLYLIAGPPGSGKTTLGNQVAFARANAGTVALYATVLAETHERMLAHLANFAFFAPELVADRVHYVSLYDELSSAGLAGALTLLRRLVRDRRASLLVVDGARLFDDFAPSPIGFRRFTSDLHATMAALGCTVLFLVDDDGLSAPDIGFQVDGVIVLEDRSVGLRDVRLLRVVKMRGADPLRGRHFFAIDRRGLEVFPRLEAVVSRREHLPPPSLNRPRLRFGIAGLDEMIGGGLLPASTTLLLGVPGTGKTCVGLSWIVEGADHGEPGLIATFDERAPQLIAKAAALGLDLPRHLATDDVRMLWRFPLDLSLDAWARELFTIVETSGIRRVFVDPAGAFQQMEMFPGRLPSFIAALIGDLRQRGVGALFAAQLRSLSGDDLDVPPPSFPVLLDNAISLRYVASGTAVRRLVSVLKVNGAAYDTSVRELLIDRRGLRLGGSVVDGGTTLPGDPTAGAAR